MTAEMLIHDTMDDETTLAEEEAMQTLEEEKAELDDLQEVQTLVWRCRPFTRRARVEGSGLFGYAELCTVTRNLFIQSECVFSS